MPYHFQGDAAHFAAAIAGNKADHVNANESRRYRPYERLLHLVGEASTAAAHHAAAILAEAEKQRDAIAVLLDAADSVLGEARAALVPVPKPAPAPAPAPKGGAE